MSDNDTVTQVRESLPDDIDARATELKRRAENRELTDAEKQVAVEDMQEMVDALRPIIREISNIVPHLASNISDTLEQETETETDTDE